jgi:hypothetical protein
MSNYALVGVPNVKIMDFLVFLGGFYFGSIAGALTGVLSWAVYGAINPYGFVPQVWLATMFSEALYGVAGGLVGKSLNSINFKNSRLQLTIFFGGLGFLLTFIYDLITNVVYALSFRIPIVVAIVFGIPFTVLHEVSNVAIFALGSMSLLPIMSNLVGGRNSVIPKK